MKNVRKRTLLALCIPWLFFFICYLNIKANNLFKTYTDLGVSVKTDLIIIFSAMIIGLILMIVIFVYLSKTLPVVKGQRLWFTRLLNDLEEDERGNLLSSNAIRFSSVVSETVLVLLMILVSFNILPLSSIVFIFLMVIIITINELSFLLYLEVNYRK